MNTITRYKNNRLDITRTVYQTAKSIKGTFSVYNVWFQIIIQLEEERSLTLGKLSDDKDFEVTKVQIRNSLYNLSHYSLYITRLSPNWYRWTE